MNFKSLNTKIVFFSLLVLQLFGLFSCGKLSNEVVIDFPSSGKKQDRPSSTNFAITAGGGTLRKGSYSLDAAIGEPAPAIQTKDGFSFVGGISGDFTDY